MLLLLTTMLCTHTRATRFTAISIKWLTTSVSASATSRRVQFFSKSTLGFDKRVVPARLPASCLSCGGCGISVVDRAIVRARVRGGYNVGPAAFAFSKNFLILMRALFACTSLRCLRDICLGWLVCVSVFLCLCLYSMRGKTHIFNNTLHTRVDARAHEVIAIFV